MPQAKPRLYRDPVHDTIAFAPDRPEGRLLIDLIDAREFQRLRRIAQLGLTRIVYHGAEHSRFGHSIGVAWLASRMLDRLEQRQQLDAEERRVTLAAALLHDVGHGPFSHTLESLSGVPHEHRSRGLVLDPSTEIHEVLASHDPKLPERVAARMSGEDGAPAFLHEIVASQLDADRMDYILRDGRMTGVRIGAYDLERILAMLDVLDGHLAVHEGGQAAVEGYLLARFHMYRQVYLHKTSRAGKCMLVAAIERAAALRRAERGPDAWPARGLGELVMNRDPGLLDFARIDDGDVWQSLKLWADDRDPVLADLADGLLRRRLWKTLRVRAADPEKRRQLVEEAREIARTEGYEPDHHVQLDEAHDSPYFAGSERAGQAIRLVDAAGEGHYIEDRSEVVRMLGQLHHRQQLLCFHPDLAGPIRDRIGGWTEVARP